MDIKLLPEARGLGIGTTALSHAIDKAFYEGDAKTVYVDPHLDNKAAWALYQNLGFVNNDSPSHLEVGETYQELTI